MKQHKLLDLLLALAMTAGLLLPGCTDDMFSGDIDLNLHGT